ncbi:4Fe-4S binding protein [candidate division KSB1 bacterium]|nr:4Fe-4S binding protein [candidate division KSB1 bacterium]
MSHYHISLWWIVAAGSLFGIFWGKVFCRWMCPIGIMMELMMKMSADTSLQSMYQYHKLGCPIARISGLLNRISLF